MSNKAWPIPITGVGCVCAAGQDAAECFASLTKGLSLLGEPSVLSSGGIEPLPLPVFTVSKSLFPEGRRHSAHDTLLLAQKAATEALQQAERVTGASREGLRVGVIIGSTAGTALHFLQGYLARRNDSSCICPDIDDLLPSNPALALAVWLDAYGPALTVSNACTSGADAVGLGADWIREDICDLVLCGGADALSLVPHTGFARLTVASHEGCKPFDMNRKGLNLGEGAAMLVLESPKRVRKEKILGTISGYGGMVDAHHFTAPHPEARGLRASIAFAMEQAGLGIENLAFVNVHGTATQENDRVEGGMIRDMLPSIPIWASKGGTGHTLGAAGAIEAVLTLLTLRAGLVPTSKGFDTVDPAIGVSPTRQTTKITNNSALSLSLGFGGGNAALILGRPATGRTA